ncbi:MAG: HlyD family secretion protein [bacterium]|nr:HlyD family secretion protein [bacterium]
MAETDATGFRPDHSSEPSFSAIELVRGPSALRILSRFLGGLFGAIFLALIILPWQQNIPGTGRVAAFAPNDRIQTVAAPVDGRVRKTWVVEGSRVEAGDRLMEIVDNDPSIMERLATQQSALAGQLASAEERVSVYGKQIEALQRARELSIEAAESEVSIATAQVRRAEAALTGARAKAEQARLNYERQSELVTDGLVSKFDFEVARRESEEAEAMLRQAGESLEAARNDERAKRADLGRIDTRATAEIESTRAERESALVASDALRERVASLETRIAQQSMQLITAPRAGTVFRVFAASGAELVKSGDPLVLLIPDTESRAVELWVDGNHVPLIDEGRPVRLQFEGWPAVQFAGWPSVAVGTFGGKVALIDPSDDGAGRFRLLVVPDENDQPWPAAEFLRQGVRAKGFVLLDQVSIGYELWRQANGFPPTVAFQPAVGTGRSAAQAERTSAPK